MPVWCIPQPGAISGMRLARTGRNRPEKSARDPAIRRGDVMLRGGRLASTIGAARA